jgi:hypothetical protein
MPRIKALIDPATACRRCPIRCDKTVFPSGCIESACSKLYAYDDGDRTFVGCMDRVFGVEIDLEAFHRIEAATSGFGALRASREPHAFCRTDVDAAFEHRANGACVNPDFLLSATRHPMRVTEHDGTTA